MSERIDKRDRSTIFRVRLAEAMAARGVTQSALARQTGVDRSTISALLSYDVRLPNAQLAADCASALGVSADWLLGLSTRPEPIADLLATSMTITEAPRALIDETIFAWHREAAGYKVRHVPATLPDMLKTRAMVEWEYSPQLGRTAEQAFGAFEDRLAWMRGARSDYEIALPIHELQAFATATGYYDGLPADVRTEQLQRLITLCDQLYPSLRICLFDARRVFSAPVTVFGPLLAVIYLGRHYLAFRDSARVETITQHFDGLVREAEVGARQMVGHLTTLLQQVRQGVRSAPLRPPGSH
ncbi:MAG: helix-turn-helix transcriptional regulator [Tabrizicola sp.]|uniref:helix-turn-helix domain-containing protein n=1 Tax=Tabrizicola sp. TaxID=2005166 RepID=UPI002733C50A|nr:helix-turn-helix transcriptional regulator [Tabrizicola sp.]MDP3261392.1 helix-turn-helix transcriptional regulator [Tabrizicola sp.]MDP3649181.1 helix-turn-helix transcriptional regulator [Paracoccaceae bacterium]MDZ4065986.1 helix-turn-helix transcriptional regulator [Tabrizicola sp.]